MNLFGCFGSKAVKNISLDDNTAILVIYFIINIQLLKIYAGKVAPVGKMLKSRYMNSAVLVG
jgi:hypothetical protein